MQNAFVVKKTLGTGTTALDRHVKAEVTYKVYLKSFEAEIVKKMQMLRIIILQLSLVNLYMYLHIYTMCISFLRRPHLECFLVAL